MIRKLQKRMRCTWVFKVLALAAMLGLSACAELVALLGVWAVDHAAHLHCEQIPSMEQRNQCLRNMDQTTPQDMRPRSSFGAASRQPAAAPSEEEQMRRRDALCIRREGLPPLCPN